MVDSLFSTLCVIACLVFLSTALSVIGPLPFIDFKEEGSPNQRNGIERKNRREAGSDGRTNGQTDERTEGRWVGTERRTGRKTFSNHAP